jgi:hypothetical protein
MISLSLARVGRGFWLLRAYRIRADGSVELLLNAEDAFPECHKAISETLARWALIEELNVSIPDLPPPEALLPP